jgi:uncharacterized SAM-binding protein YcdF (DUF218 family)
MRPVRLPGTTEVAVIVHGHRDGNAVGGRPWISEECLARLRVAERAAEHPRVRDVLLCGAGASDHPSEALQMARAWRGPAVRLWLDEDSTDSAENAQRALTWMESLGTRHLLVVSSWWHLRLALYYRPFKAMGFVVHHATTHRCDRALSHLAHELRYLPRALRPPALPAEASCPGVLT